MDHTTSNAENLDVLSAYDAFSVQQILDLQGTPEEIAQFQEEVEDRIFFDVIEAALAESLTDEQVQEVTELLNQDFESTERIQVALMGELERVMPDFKQRIEAAMRETKEDLLMARLEGLKEYWAEKPESLAILTAAEGQVSNLDIAGVLKTLSTLPKVAVSAETE